MACFHQQANGCVSKQNSKEYRKGCQQVLIPLQCYDGWSSHQSTILTAITRKAQHSIWNPQNTWREPVPWQKMDTRIDSEDWDADLKTFNLVTILRTQLLKMLKKCNGREPVPNPFCTLKKRQPFRQILIILTLAEKWWRGAMSEKVTTLVKSDIGVSLTRPDGWMDGWMDR